MNWFKRKMLQWIQEERESSMIRPSRESEPIVCDTDAILNFRVFSAVGGQVVEFTRFDRVTDRRDTTTYIINKDEDFGTKISKIANLELLK